MFSAVNTDSTATPWGSKFFDQFAEHRMDFAEALGKMFGTLARGAQRAEAQHPAAPPVTFNHSVASGSCRGGINAEHPEEDTARSRQLWHGTECTARTPRATIVFSMSCARET